jgi:lipopolysaccharide export system permease protein
VTDQRRYQITRPFQRTYFKSQEKVFDLSEFALNRTNEEIFKNNYQMLNIRQLNYSIDSLQIALVNRKESFAKNFNRNFRFYMVLDEDTIVPDTLYPAEDILSNFEPDDQKRIVENAIGQARNLKKSLSYYTNEYDDKTEYINKHKVVWHKKFTLSFACLVLFFIGAPLGAIIRKGGLGLPVVMSVLFFVIYHIISMIGEKSAKGGAMDVAFGMWLSSLILLPIGGFLTYKATTDAPIMDREIWNKVFTRFNFVKRFRRGKS